MDAKTQEIHNWMKNLPDDSKMRFAINWRIPHSLFNVACAVHPKGVDYLQGIDWYTIHKSRDLGYWFNGNGVCVLG